MSKKLPGQAAPHIAALTHQSRPGETIPTPCPYCGTSLPRLAAIQHAQNCRHGPSRGQGPARPAPATGPDITIDSPESMGARGQDGMEDA